MLTQQSSEICHDILSNDISIMSFMRVYIESNELLLALLFLTFVPFAAAKMGKIEISKFLTVSKLKEAFE